MEFREIQRMRQAWVWLLLLGVNALGIFGVYKQLYLGEPFGTNPASNGILIAIVLLVFSISMFMLTFRLETRINGKGVYVRFHPLHWKERFYAWQDIEEANLRTYRPLAEYGGWGIRGLGKNRALNMSGNKGLQLVFRSGKRLLIGTNKPEDLENALQELKPEA